MRRNRHPGAHARIGETREEDRRPSSASRPPPPLPGLSSLVRPSRTPRPRMSIGVLSSSPISFALSSTAREHVARVVQRRGDLALVERGVRVPGGDRSSSSRARWRRPRGAATPPSSRPSSRGSGSRAAAPSPCLPGLEPHEQAHRAAAERLLRERRASSPRRRAPGRRRASATNCADVAEERLQVRAAGLPELAADEVHRLDVVGALVDAEDLRVAAVLLDGVVAACSRRRRRSGSRSRRRGSAWSLPYAFTSGTSRSTWPWW